MKRTDGAPLIQLDLLLLLTLTGLFAARVGNASASEHKDGTLRVGFWTLWHDRQIQLAPAGATTYRTCEQCPVVPLREEANVRVDPRGGLLLAAGGTTIHANSILLNGQLKISGHGESELLHFPVAVRARSGSLVIAVTLPVESYVERVVASESGPLDTLESLKALAIVVRSYALHERHGHPDYDVCDSTHCQLLHWHGVPQRSFAAHQAALRTAGETLWFRNEPALDYFTKDCGGQSAALQDVWPRAAPKPYLASHPDAFCSRTPSEQWSSDLTRAEIAAALARRQFVAPGWQHLAIEQRSVSGRAITVRLDRTVISAEEFRIAIGESLGWNRVQSSWFEISEKDDHFYFHGRGAGHGVGLCQKGAAMMASQGLSATEILAAYFAGTHAADEATGKRWITSKGSGFVLESTDSSDTEFLPAVARARAEASERSGLNADAPITVRAFASTSAFRTATLAPGWVAAFAEGDWIATQPLRVLAGRRLLADTLRHEFLHALLEAQAGADAPLWLREGLVEFWGMDPVRQSTLPLRGPSMKLDALEGALSHPQSEPQAQAAHREAAIYARGLLDNYGRDRVLGWLRSGVPADVMLRLGQR
jgi:stage II sporulation protein D